MGVVIRRWVWLESIGVVSGCFPHITYISLLVSALFLQQHPYFFFHFVKMIFRSFNIVLSGHCVHCVLLLIFVCPLHLQGCECVGKHYLAYFV